MYATLPNADCWLRPSMYGWGMVTSGVLPSGASPPLLPPGAGRFGSSWTPGKTIGASRIVKAPRPNVAATRLFGSPILATARPVVGSMLPIARLRSDTCTFGKRPPGGAAAVEDEPAVGAL